MIAALALWGCGHGVELRVSEAYDVPPPPGQRSLRLDGPHPHPIELGQTLSLDVGGHAVRGDVVDHRDQPAEIVVYVPEPGAAAALDAGSIRLGTR